MTTTLPGHLERLGKELDAAWELRYGVVMARPRRQPVRRIILALAVPVVAVVAAVLALGGGPGAVEQALAAAGDAPANTIVHFVSIPRGPSGDMVQRAEMWGASSPPYARRWVLQANDSPPVEQGARGNLYTQYDPAGVVYVRTLDGGIAEGTRPPDFGARPEQVKAHLRSGNARAAGELTIRGETVRRFLMTTAAGETCVYDVQPDTFFGVRLTCNGPDGSTSQRWKYLPRAGNECLLSVRASHPEAAVDRARIGACVDERHTASTPPCVAVLAGG